MKLENERSEKDSLALADEEDREDNEDYQHKMSIQTDDLSLVLTKAETENNNDPNENDQK